MKAFKTLIILALILIPAFLFAATYNTHLIITIHTDTCTNCGDCAEVAPSGFVATNDVSYYFTCDPPEYYGDDSTFDCYDSSLFNILRNMAEVCPASAISFHSEQIG